MGFPSMGFLSVMLIDDVTMTPREPNSDLYFIYVLYHISMHLYIYISRTVSLALLAYSCSLGPVGHFGLFISSETLLF